jgi:Binding-prot-dependent transport system membrane comp, N-term
LDLLENYITRKRVQGFEPYVNQIPSFAQVTVGGVTAYLIRRILYSAFVLWGAKTIVFVSIRLVPGDPTLPMLSSDATPETLQALRTKLGVNEPGPVQYMRFLQRVATFDFGDSIRQGRPVTAALGDRLPNTAQLAVIALVRALALNFPLGITAGGPASARHCAPAAGAPPSPQTSDGVAPFAGLTRSRPAGSAAT